MAATSFYPKPTWSPFVIKTLFLFLGSKEVVWVADWQRGVKIGKPDLKQDKRDKNAEKEPKFTKKGVNG